MKSEREIKERLEAFRRKYDGKDPANLGILAAVQRAYLYALGANHVQIRTYWSDLLHSIGNHYLKKADPDLLRESFFNDIQTIKFKMNAQFPNSFSNSRNDFDNEFRLAHAQKSLSVYLKHLWSRNELDGNLPPTCPIDGIILKKVGVYDPWTRINSFEDYTINNKTTHGYYHYLSVIEDAASQTKDPLAVWELFQWKP